MIELYSSLNDLIDFQEGVAKEMLVIIQSWGMCTFEEVGNRVLEPAAAVR